MTHILVERGASKADCCQKIVQKYGIYFTVLRERTISKGFLRRREEVEVEFCVAPPKALSPMAVSPQAQAQLPAPAALRDRQVVGLAPPLPGGGGTMVDFEEAKRKLISSAGRDPDKVLKDAASHSRRQEDEESGRQQMMEMMREMREMMRSQAEQQKQHPALARIEGMLRQNDFSAHYSERLLERARRELPLEILENFELAQDRALEWIGESIGIFRPPERAPRKPGEQHPARVVALVGPTGVGKTTTIAKLAAMYGHGVESAYGQRSLSVRLITIDMFRMGAEHQIEKYANIMEIPLSFIDSRMDLQKELDLHREVADLILVDTIGRSPSDSKGLGEMKEILDACGPKAETHLALAAGTKAADLAHIMQQFEPFNYKAALLTKLDETMHVGNVISALAEKGKPVSYVTLGQSVPRNIKKASVIQFLAKLEEFRLDREALEKRFPAADAG